MFKKDQPVTVSNGQPRPPKHHKQKLKSWECYNYDGFVAENQKPGEDTVPVYKSKLGMCICFVTHISQITPREQ